jgi:hypothetical protein
MQQASAAATPAKATNLLTNASPTLKTRDAEAPVRDEGGRDRVRAAGTAKLTQGPRRADCSIMKQRPVARRKPWRSAAR